MRCWVQLVRESAGAAWLRVQLVPRWVRMQQVVVVVLRWVPRMQQVVQVRVRVVRNLLLEKDLNSTQDS